MSLDLRNVRSFIEAAETLHFGDAARRVHISQPALSRQIQKLERDLGFQLFDRSGAGVALTRAGQTFLKDAVQVLDRVEWSVERARRIDRGEAGNLRIGFVASITFNLVPSLLRAFRAQAQDVRLELREMGTAQQLSAVHADKLDVGLVRSPLPQEESLNVRYLRHERIVAVLPAGHRLASRRELDVSELAGESFVMYPRSMGPGLFDCIIAVCRRAGFSPNVHQEAALIPTIVGLVAAGLGVALVPESVEPLGGDAVVYRPLEDDQAVTELIAVWRADNDNPALRTFFQSLP